MPLVKTSKDEILAKSTLLIWERGFHQASFSELSKACGIRNAHFYYYFKDKEDLMMQVLNTSYSFFEEKVFSIAHNKSLTAKVRLSKMVRLLDVIYTKNYGGCIFGNTVLESAHNENPFLDVVKKMFDAYTAALKDIFSERLSEEEAQQLAIKTIQQVQGALMMVRLYKDHSYIRNFLNSLEA